MFSSAWPQIEDGPEGVGETYGVVRTDAVFQPPRPEVRRRAISAWNEVQALVDRRFYRARDPKRSGKVGFFTQAVNAPRLCARSFPCALDLIPAESAALKTKWDAGPPLQTPA